jgi:hypothetical protein
MMMLLLMQLMLLLCAKTLQLEDFATEPKLSPPLRSNDAHYEQARGLSAACFSAALLQLLGSSHNRYWRQLRPR